MSRPLLISCLALALVHYSTAQGSITTVSGTHAPTNFGSGDLIFEDTFDTLDLKVWQHELTLGGGGNWEFQWYDNSRYNSYIQDGQLYIKPSLVSDYWGEDFITSGNLDINGGDPASACTNPAWYGCARVGTGANALNPVKSARIRTVESFAFKYGRVEVRAKLPAGDWLWPAIWMLPRWNVYSGWPTSGEIDIMESRGNRQYTDNTGQQIGTQLVGQTLHWGPFWNINRYDLTHSETRNGGGFDQDFHTYGVQWDENTISFSIDGQQTASYSPPNGGFWEMGDLDSSGFPNPWTSGSKMAPFDQEYYIIINLAVGGVAYFPDDASNGNGGKPWSNTSPAASTDFWNGRNQWIPTWNLDSSDDAALVIDYVRVWAA